MTQSRINTEREAGRLLRRLAAYGWHTVLPSAATEWLVRRGYAYWGNSRSQLFMSEPRFDSDNNRIPGPMTGREYYESLCRNPAVTESPAKWKEEARSGMKIEAGKVGTVTVQSEIDRACIPKPSGPGVRATPESILDGMQRDMAARVKWAEKLGVSPAELERYGMEGRIRMCSSCGEVGIFDRDRGGFQGACRKCRKERR